MFGKIGAKVKSGLVLLQASTLHDGFKFALVVPEIPDILKIASYSVIHAEQSTLCLIFMLGRAVMASALVELAAFNKGTAIGSSTWT